MYVLKNMHYDSILTVYNDSVPLKGNLAINTSPRKPPDVYPFENGQIDPQDRLVIKLSEDMHLDLVLEKESGGLKLDGTLYRRENPGRITLLKMK